MAVISNLKTVQANGSDGITVDTDAYTANDVVGGLLTFDVPMALGGGLINRVRAVDEDSLNAALNLYLFDAAPTTIADDAAFAPTIADLNKLVAVVAISSWTTVNSLDYWHSDALNYAFATDVGKLYGYLECTGTPNFTNADALQVYLDIVSEG